MNKRVDLGITEEAAEGLINEQSMDAARALVGCKLRPEQYLRDASTDSIIIFANGIGDLNPLYRDQEYSRAGHALAECSRTRASRGLTTGPAAPIGVARRARIRRDDRLRVFPQRARPGDRINVWNRVLGIEEKPSKFSGKMAMQYLDSTYTNQRDEVVCKALGLTARHERKASRDKGKYKDVRTHVYTKAESDAIDEKIMNEPAQVRGALTRYWDDVKVGDAIDEIVRGPLSMSDTMAFVIASGRGAAHGALLKHAAKHPKHYIRNKDGGGGVEYTGIGHHREDFAKKVGVPGMYDYLPQRACWFVSAITNWMGDDGVIKRIRMEARMFNLQGDTTFINGKVVKKYLKDGCPLIDIEMTGVNQRGELSSPGFATVMLPAKDINTRIPTDGTVVDLELPPIR